MKSGVFSTLVSVLFLATFPTLAQEVKTSQQEHDEEVAGREERARRNDQRMLRLYGTTDLSDVTRRGIEQRIREIERDRRLPLALAGPAWTFLGPTVRTHRSAPDGNDSGLVASIAIHPTAPKTLLVGTAGGGVWRTTDGGATWAIATEGIGVLQIGAVAYAPSDGNIAYAGTGCADASTYQLGNATNTPAWRVGVGLLGSSDGGATWRVITPAGQAGPANYFWQILVDPQTPTTLLVAGDKGIQRSTDGGVTFTAVLASETAPWATALSPAGATLYASTWGPRLQGSVYKSTDNGLTWTEKATGLPGDGSRQRVNVAASATNPNRVYALVDGSGKQIDMARSDDGGDSWTPLKLNEKNVDILSAQGASMNALSVSPTNADVVHAGGLDHWFSVDGGSTWKHASDWAASGARPYLHADQHAHTWTSDGKTLYIGNDGGLFSTADGSSFVGLNRGTETFLVSGVCHDPRNLDRIAFGAQDNGNTIRVSGTTYRETGTGDGYACSFHPANDKIVHVSTQHQGIERSTDGGTTWENAVEGLTDAGEKNGTFSTLLFRSSTEPDRIFTSTKKRIWTSADNGTSWTPLSQHMPHISEIADFWVSPKDPKQMALIDVRGRLETSKDGGVTWEHKGDLTGESFGSTRIDTSDPNRVYVASRTTSRGEQRLFLSTDGGATFAPISNTGADTGLPDVPVQILEQDLASSNVWWAGTFIGLYRSSDRGVTWARYGTGLPNVPVMTLALTADGSRLRAGTHGRGIWEISGNAAAAQTRPGLSPSPLAIPAASFTFSPTAPRPGRRVKFADASTGAPSSWSWDFGDGSTSKERSPYHVYPNPGRYNVSLTVTNSSGTGPAVVKPVTVAYPDTGTGSLLTYLFPVVLTTAGAGGTQFSTEITLTNRSTKSLFLTFRVKGTFEASSPEYELTPGQEVQPDVFVFLKQAGMIVPSGNLVTSLRIEVRGAENIGQFGGLVRVLTPPNADQRGQGIAGRFGLSFPALPLGTGASKEAVVYGLQQTSSAGTAGTRSNLACVNAGGGFSGSTDLQLEVTYRDGETGNPHATKDTFTLSQFQFAQKNEPLSTRGLKHAVATVKRTAGTDQFVCYGVLNDNLNGDGSFVPMVITDPQSTSSEAVVPVIVGTSTFRSEVTISNRSPVKVEGEFAVVPAANPEPIYGDFEVPAGGQLVIPDIVAELNKQGFKLSDTATVATMSFEFEEAPGGDVNTGVKLVPTSQVNVSVRTYAKKAGGLFGLAYGYSPVGSAADTEAYVYGLQQTGSRGQDGGTRSNLAVVHAYGGHEENLQLEITYFDGYDGRELGKEVCTPAPCTLKPGENRQFNAPLERYGVTDGYARIKKLSGSDQFLAYGTLVDQANDDGSYVPMTIP